MTETKTKQVIVLSGLPGSGKTTYAERLLAGPGGADTAVVSADDFFTDGEGNYAFDVGKIAEAHRACWRAFFSNVQAGAGVIVVDNTNLSSAEIASYVLPAEAHGYTVKVVRVDCNYEEAFARQKHGVPLEVFEKMIEAWKARDVKPWWTVVTVTANKACDCIHVTDHHDHITGACHYTNPIHGPCPCAATPPAVRAAQEAAWAVLRRVLERERAALGGA